MTTRAILLGLFDGVHKGHLEAVNALMSSGADRKTVYTFYSAELKTKGERRLILTDGEKKEMLISLGADEVIFERFENIKDLSPEEFVKCELVSKLKADIVICGENFRFGKNASGDTSALEELLKAQKVRLVAAKTLCVDGLAVSTTRIRGLLEQGNVEDANRLLGYRYFIAGEVVHGDARGRTMGIRTVNISFDASKILPASGVYGTTVTVGQTRYRGVTNVGTRPTFKQNGEKGVETHILDFVGDVYGNTVSIEFNNYYREEREFASSSELIEAITKDITRRKEEEV